jgi:ankyrin repeat protein
MVKLGGDVNYTISGISPQADGAYPLMAASQQGRLEILEELIKNKVDLEKPHKDGSRCVWGAAFMGLLGSLRVLLDGGADVNAINLTDGSAPLTAAVLSKLATKENLLAIVRLLIDRGADVHAVDYKGRSAFFESCATGNMDVIRHLFSVGAKYEQREREQGFTPFLKACQKGNHEAVLFLLEKGVDVHQHDNGGLFPLFMAAQGGHGRCVASLLEAGASVTQRRVTGATALFIAAHEGHVAVIRQLHEEGADVNARAIDCHTPLSIAVSEGRKDAVKTLLELGAEENYILRGSTMLGLAQRNGHSEIAALLRARQSQA